AASGRRPHLHTGIGGQRDFRGRGAQVDAGVRRAAGTPLSRGALGTVGRRRNLSPHRAGRGRRCAGSGFQRRRQPCMSVSLDDIRAARESISGGTVYTPLLPAQALRDRLPCDLYIKMESAQRTGSFKDRGALFRMQALTPDERKRGVVTASAGNHAQAVAYHGSRLGVPVQVVMPEHTPLVKVTNTRRHGAEVRLHGATLTDSMVEVNLVVEEEGRILVHAFDDDRVMAGQGTIGLELLEQLPKLTALIVPIGGGGLISGIATAIPEQRHEVRVYGVEAAPAASALESRKAGHIVTAESFDTIADGIAVKRPGDRTFPVIE